jgi:hypothetical protein
LHVANTATGKSLEIETTEADKGVNTQYVKPIVFLKWAISKGYSIPKILRPILHNMNIHNPDLDLLRDTDVWSDLENKIIHAMKEYPGWKKLEGKNKNGLGNLTSWVKEICNAKVREAELIKDVLSEVYKISK